MAKIKFTRDSGDYESDTRHAAGSVLEVNEASAQRWVRRGAAELVKDEPSKTNKTKTAIKAADKKGK